MGAENEPGHDQHIEKGDLLFLAPLLVLTLYVAP